LGTIYCQFGRGGDVFGHPVYYVFVLTVYTDAKATRQQSSGAWRRWRS